MELIIKTDLQAFPAVIEYNHEELKSELSEQLQKYKNIVVTEDSIKEFKADKANLNRLKTALEDKRKEVKKQCLQPYENFEKNIKELIALIEEPIKVIDSQLKEIESKKKEEKANEIEKIYYDNIGKFEQLVPLDKIFHSKWLNTTYKLNDITLEIKEVYSNIENGLQIIEGLNTEFKQEIKDKFFETLDITKALSENARLKELREKQKAIEEQKEQQVRKFLLEKEKQQAERKESENVEKTQQEQQYTENLEVLDIRVWITPTQKILLHKFFKDNNITFGRVK
jgi:hypothetical protein